MTIFRSFVTAFVLVVFSTTSASAATYKIATLSPDGSSWMKLLRKHAKNIEERTGGEVKFKFFPGGVMGDDKAVMRKMRVGQLHGAVITAGGLAQVYPDIVIYNLPMLFQSDSEVDHVRQTLDPALMAGLRERKFVGFGFAEVGFAYPMGQRSATALDDVRSFKVWTPDNDPASLQAFQAFDISPIPLPIADVLAGLQTGLIDSIASPPIGAIALQWHTQVQYALDMPLLYVYGLFTMSERSFAKISPAHQQIVTEEWQAAVAAADASARKDHNSAKAALSKQGIEWLVPKGDNLQEWRDVAADAREAAVADGLISPDKYQTIKTLLEEHRSQ